MSDPVESKVYQLKIHLMNVSPMVWRRIVIKDDTSIAKLHGILQIVMGWENIHLHHFRIYGKEYGISYSGGSWFSDDPQKVLLKDFAFQVGDKFYYEYNFYSDWKHQIRLEKILDTDEDRFYPYCIAGKQACPPEIIDTHEQFSEIRDLFKIPLFNLAPILKLQENIGYNWHANIFKKSKINKYLKEEDYELMPQNGPYFPNRSRGYFEDVYWKSTKEYEGTKNIYLMLKRSRLLKR